MKDVAIRVDTPESERGSATIYEPQMQGQSLPWSKLLRDWKAGQFRISLPIIRATRCGRRQRLDCALSGQSFWLSVYASCSASLGRLTQNWLPGAHYGLTGPDLHRLIPPALGGRLRLFHPSHSVFAGRVMALSWGSKICLERRQ